MRKRRFDRGFAFRVVQHSTTGGSTIRRASHPTDYRDSRTRLRRIYVGDEISAVFRKRSADPEFCRWQNMREGGEKLVPFDMRQLQYALAAADHGSFYRAARALNVEQSTLSRAILKLERSVGMPIFKRSRAGITTTLAGDAFIRGAKPMVAAADKLVAMMRAAGQGRAGGLMLGHNSSVSAGNLRATLTTWCEGHPEVDIECMEDNRSVLLGGLDRGDIDIAILMGTANYDGFRCEPFWSERMLVALPQSHPLTTRDVIHWTDLRGERFVLPAADPGSEIRDMLLGRLALSGHKPDIRVHQASRETILSVLTCCSGVSIVCEGSTGAHYPDVVYRPIHGEQGPALIGYSGCWRDDNNNPALRRFLGFIKARFALSFDFSPRFQ